MKARLIATKRIFSVKLLKAVLLGLLSGTCFQIASKELPDYHKTTGLSGNLTSIGSDTLASMFSLWGEAFKTYYPNINVQVQASGSSTAAPALTQGMAQFGSMSRPMRIKERQAFEMEHGYQPIELKVAIDAIGIFVHKDNPLKGVSFQQIDAIFSTTLRCGGTKPLNSWLELGLQTDWSKRRFQLFGRNSVSGTYGYFKQTVLCGGDFKSRVNELPGAASVVQSVASGINAIGYSGIGSHASGAKLLPVSEHGDDYITPTKETILNGEYPLSRYLYIYINKHPTKELSLLEKEFIRFIYSRQGQLIVEKEGYVAISEQLARWELEKVGL